MLLVSSSEVSLSEALKHCVVRRTVELSFFYDSNRDESFTGFGFEIFNFPEELKAECTTEFSIGNQRILSEDGEQRLVQKGRFQSSFEGTLFSGGRETSATARIMITKKMHKRAHGELPGEPEPKKCRLSSEV